MMRIGAVGEPPSAWSPSTPFRLHSHPAARERPCISATGQRGRLLDSDGCLFHGPSSDSYWRSVSLKNSTIRCSNSSDTRLASAHARPPPGTRSPPCAGVLGRGGQLLALFDVYPGIALRMDDVDWSTPALADGVQRVVLDQVLTANHAAHDDCRRHEEGGVAAALQLPGEHLLQVAEGGLQEQRSHLWLLAEGVERGRAAERVGE